MKNLTVPKITITTSQGKFGLRVARSDLVQISGSFKFQGGAFPFSLTLQKTGKEWQACEAGLEKFAELVIKAFAAWADTHPKIFEMGDRIRRHNADAGLHVTKRKVSTRTR